MKMKVGEIETIKFVISSPDISFMQAKTLKWICHTQLTDRPKGSSNIFT
jgi:hypothetical protein